MAAKRVLIVALKINCGMQIANFGRKFLLRNTRKLLLEVIFLRYISPAFEKGYRKLCTEGDSFEDVHDVYTIENARRSTVV